MDMKTRPHNLMVSSEFEAFGKALDEIRQDVMDDLGRRDVDHIKGVMHKQRLAEIMGRGLIHFSLNPVTWAAGVGLLSASKILENMEIGHNIMHGQYDWTNDPELQSQSYDWDNVCDADSWRKTHNYEHHTYTNILGKDRDYGYAVLRLDDGVEWKPWHLVQFIQYGMLSGLFEYGVALHELEFDRVKSGEVKLKDKVPFLKRFAAKTKKQVKKDYILYPLLAGPMAPKVIAGNALANLGRNLWASTIIFCGHFTEGAQTFREQDCENESRGQWYYRQLLGSSNFTGGKWLHIMSGHLSYQVEHHMFPDIPAHRYPEIAPKVQALCEQYEIPYNTGPFSQQLKTVLKRVGRYSLPPEESKLSAFVPKALKTAFGV